MKTVVENQYWDKHWSYLKTTKKKNAHPISFWLERYLQKVTNSKSFEIGCYPGKFLSVIGNFGYELNGVDFVKQVNEMTQTLKSDGYNVGKIYKNDFFKLNLEEKYDLVCSFGFIEHFDNWKEVIDKHFEITKEKGLCIIEVPNLASPLYFILYKILEPNVISSHNLEAMSLRNITNHIKDSHEIVCSEYIGDFYFRFVTKVGRKYTIIENIINKIGKVFNILPKSVSCRYLGVIAKN